jgi:hypothetical protein
VWYRHQLHPRGIREITRSARYGLYLKEHHEEFYLTIAQQLTSISIPYHAESLMWLLRAVDPTKLQKVIMNVYETSLQMLMDLFKSWGSLPNVSQLSLELSQNIEADEANLLLSIISDSIPRIQFLELRIYNIPRGFNASSYAATCALLRSHADTLVQASVDFPPVDFLPSIVGMTSFMQKDWKIVDDDARARTGLGLDVLRFGFNHHSCKGKMMSLRRMIAEAKSSYDDLDELYPFCWPSDKYSPSASLSDIPEPVWHRPHLQVWAKGPLEQQLKRLIDSGVVDWRVMMYLEMLMGFPGYEITRIDLAEEVATRYHLQSTAEAAATVALWKEMIQKVLALNRPAFEEFFKPSTVHVLVSLPLDFYRDNPCQLELSHLVNTPSRFITFVEVAPANLVELILRAVPQDVWLYHRFPDGVLALLIEKGKRIDERKGCITYVMELLESDPAEVTSYCDSVSMMCNVVEHDWLADAFGRLSLKSLPLWRAYVDFLQTSRNREEVLENIRRLLDITMRGVVVRNVKLPSVEFAEPLWIGVIRHCAAENVLEELAGKILDHCTAVPTVVKTFVSGGSARMVSRIPAAKLRECLSRMISNESSGKRKK